MQVQQISDVTSICDMLTGENAFYNYSNIQNPINDFKFELLPTTYVSNTENKIIRIAKQILSIIIFPVGVYWLLHSLVGKVVLLSSSPSLLGKSKYSNFSIRDGMDLDKDIKYKRLTIETDGIKIDAVIMGKPFNLDRGKWMLYSCGNAESYEIALDSGRPQKIMSELNVCGIIFNYAGVSASSGLPSRQSMVKAYRAVLRFLEDEKNGIGAKKIIGFGNSIGGGVQAEACKDHEFKKEIKYVFIKNKTFSNLSTVARGISGWPIGLLVKIMGWNIDTLESSRNLPVPEIILQTANVKKHTILKDSSEIIHDQVISAEASLAKNLLDEENNFENKVFIGVNENHNEEISDFSLLSKVIKDKMDN